MCCQGTAPGSAAQRPHRAAPSARAVKPPGWGLGATHLHGRRGSRPLGCPRTRQECGRPRRPGAGRRHPPHALPCFDSLARPRQAYGYGRVASKPATMGLRDRVIASEVHDLAVPHRQDGSVEREDPTTVVQERIGRISFWPPMFPTMMSLSPRPVARGFPPTAAGPRQMQPVLLARERVRIPAMRRHEHVQPPVAVQVREGHVPGVHGVQRVGREQLVRSSRDLAVAVTHVDRPGCGL